MRVFISGAVPSCSWRLPALGLAVVERSRSTGAGAEPGLVAGDLWPVIGSRVGGLQTNEQMEERAQKFPHG
jgi:hypothetical protein